jgi:hypothetical protein
MKSVFLYKAEPLYGKADEKCIIEAITYSSSGIWHTLNVGNQRSRIDGS